MFSQSHSARKGGRGRKRKINNFVRVPRIVPLEDVGKKGGGKNVKKEVF